MKKFLLLMVVSLVILPGCSMKRYGLPPFNPDFMPASDSAIVLFGYNSDEDLINVVAAGDFDGTIIPGWGLLPKNQLNAVAICNKLGESFQVISLPYASSMNHSSSFRFKNLPNLQLNKPGLYYYGYFQLKEGKALFTKEYIDDVITTAMAQYPTIFKTFKPVNFEYSK